MTIGTYYTAKVDNRTCFVDGVQYGTIATPEVSSRIYPAYVFAYNRSPMLYGKMRLASLKISDANGVLVRDYIPVRKGTTGELYDRVSGKFAERHGDFVVGPDVVPATWVDGEYWNTLGVESALSGASRCEDFIPVQPSSTVTFYLGARPGGTTLYMVQYNANKERVNSTYNGNGVARTVTIPANCYYIRVSAETTKKNEAYIHDDTNDRYLLCNGMIPIPAS